MREGESRLRNRKSPGRRGGGRNQISAFVIIAAMIEDMKEASEEETRGGKVNKQGLYNLK